MNSLQSHLRDSNSITTFKYQIKGEFRLLITALQVVIGSVSFVRGFAPHWKTVNRYALYFNRYALCLMGATIEI